MATHDWFTANINLVPRFSNHRSNINSLEGIIGGHFMHTKIMKGHERKTKIKNFKFIALTKIIKILYVIYVVVTLRCVIKENEFKIMMSSISTYKKCERNRKAGVITLA